MGKKQDFVSKRRPADVKPEPPKTQILESKPPPPPPPKEDTSVPGSRAQSSHGSRVDLAELDQEFEGEIWMKKTHDLDTLKKVIEEYEALMGARLTIADKNINADYEEFEKLRNSRKLDANLKKCTNFVKKLKGFTSAQFDQIEKEFQGLNLSKYLSEIATALTEARFKISDIQIVVNLFSMFHRRYREFASFVLEIYHRILLPRKSDFSPAITSKLPVDIRLFGELVMCGLFDKEEGFSLVLSAIKNIISTDKDAMAHAALIITFSRGLGFDMADLIPTNIKELSEEHKMYLPKNNWISVQKKEQMKQILFGYYNTCCEEVVKYHEDLLKSEMKNRKLLKSKGEIPEDRKTAHSEAVIKFETNFAVIKKFASYIDKELPALKELPADPEADQADSMLRILNAEHGDAVLPANMLVFEDDETRAFYQDLPDMKVYLPQIVYRENILKAAEQTAEIERREKEFADVDEELEIESLKAEKAEEEEDETADADTGDVFLSEQAEDDKGEVIKPTFQAFLTGLTNCFNTSMIDQAAREFVDNFNTKPNRRKLVDTLFRIPWQRVDLIPLWARLVAVLAPVMPEVQLDLCQMLYRDFRYLVRKRDQLFIETKLKIVRFIGELVKFGTFPKSDAFQCFKILLLNFTHHQIEMACAFMETCGRFLHRNVDSHRRMQIYLEEFMRRKSLKSLDARHVGMVDYAYSIVCPREDGPKRKTPPLLAFMKYTIYDKIQRSNLEDTIKTIRALDWDENPKVAEYFGDVMSKPWKLRFQQYSVCSSLLAAIVPYRSELSFRIVDAMLEGTLQMMCYLHPSYNSQRVSMVIYLGEFYNYRLVGSSEIFTVLYALITMQVVLDHSYMNSFDPPDNLFRIRLVCTLLKTCGMYFNHGNSKKKLNCFLKYFLRYYWFKKSSPIWTELRRFPFVMNDLVDETMHSLRPKWRVPSSFEEACTDVTEMEDKLRKTYFSEQMHGEQYQLHDIPEDEPYERESPFTMSGGYTQEDDPLDLSPTPSVDMNTDDPETVTEANWEKFKPTDGELAEFDAQMERLAIEHGGGRHAKADIPVPIKTSPAKGLKSADGSRTGTINVALLTKKGNKQQLKHIVVSEDTEFVRRITASQEAEEQERRRIKQLTLGINRRQQEEEQAAEFLQKYQSLFKPRSK